jgi:hypothetical protein
MLYDVSDNDEGGGGMERTTLRKEQKWVRIEWRSVQPQPQSSDIGA